MDVGPGVRILPGVDTPGWINPAPFGAACRILFKERSTMPTAKIFQRDDNQAVLLPRELRFPVGIEEVAIRRQGDQIILEPLERKEWPEDFWHAFGELSPDFERPR
jgi:virulence-associated protein VagC